MESFAATVKTIAAKLSILDVCGGPCYAPTIANMFLISISSLELKERQNGRLGIIVCNLNLWFNSSRTSA